jgi:hypothetical protein
MIMNDLPTYWANPMRIYLLALIAFRPPPIVLIIVREDPEP